MMIDRVYAWLNRKHIRWIAEQRRIMALDLAFVEGRTDGMHTMIESIKGDLEEAAFNIERLSLGVDVDDASELYCMAVASGFRYFATQLPNTSTGE